MAVQAFQEIAKVHVTENIFSQFMYKMLPTCNHLWSFKKSFCMQLALSGTFLQLHNICMTKHMCIGIYITPSAPSFSSKGFLMFSKAILWRF